MPPPTRRRSTPSTRAQTRPPTRAQTPCRTRADASNDVATTDAPVMDASRDAATDGAQTDASGGACGTRGAGPCPAGMYCNHPISAMCGVFDAPGRCETPPSLCTRELNPVCGCDGMDYSNPCVAASNRVSVARMGTCGAADGGATDVATTDAGACAAQDAAGVGACDRLLGYAFNGRSCVSLSGCTCEGAACRSLFMSMEACQAAYPSCDCRTTGCPGTSTCMGCRGPSGGVFVCIPAGAVC